ncbi:MAG: hypothetical protein VW982_05610 [Candidatus Poseidoniales archaeon]
MNKPPGLVWPAPANRIENLRPNTPVRRLELVVLRMYPRRMIVSTTYTGPVAAACGRDDSGLVGLVFWGEQVTSVNVGDIIRIESGWCRSRDGALVVSTGKHGKLSIVKRFDA